MKAQHWFDAVQKCQHKGEAYALVTVLGCTGSTPRDQSSKMVITGERCYDTIGGGHLEFVVTNKARELLANNQNSQEIDHFPLGASLGQCCGGSATVLIETFAACTFQVGVFGAGHVAKALMNILAGLPCQVSWVDSRAELFPAPQAIADNISAIVSDDPGYEMENMPAGADVLILTHNHQLDYELCEQALKNPGIRHIGLIGSETKAKRFIKRLSARGFSEQDIARVKCPVGISSIPGKLPMEVAVSIAGELIAIQNSDQPKESHRGLGWQELKQELISEENAEQRTVDSTGKGSKIQL